MSPENLEWSQTNSIQMSVQTADLFLLNETQNEQLNLSCTLLTIARGKCNVEIRPQIETSVSISNEQQKDNFYGNIVIPKERPVMECEGLIPPNAFKALYEKFVSIQSVGRPIILTIFLDEKLSVSVSGDLFIEDTRKILINHIDFIFPLR